MARVAATIPGLAERGWLHWQMSQSSTDQSRTKEILGREKKKKKQTYKQTNSLCSLLPPVLFNKSPSAQSRVWVSQVNYQYNPSLTKRQNSHLKHHTSQLCSWKGWTQTYVVLCGKSPSKFGKRRGKGMRALALNCHTILDLKWSLKQCQAGHGSISNF